MVAYSKVQCAFAGCSAWFEKHLGHRYCQRHRQLLLDLAKKTPTLPPPPQPRSPPPLPPPRPTPSPQGEASPSAPKNPLGRRHRSTQKALDALKRKMAKRSQEE